MLDIAELFVINRALDGKDIKGLPGFDIFRKKKELLFLIDTIKEKMIKAGILEDFNHFTKKGLREAKKLKEYKNAKKYVSLLGMNIAILDEKRGIVLERVNTRQYELNRIDLETWVCEIFETYHDWCENSKTEEKGVRASRTQISRQFYQTSCSGFFLITDTAETHYEELFYANDTGNFQYDYEHGLLFMISKEKLQETVKERFHFEENVYYGN